MKSSGEHSLTIQGLSCDLCTGEEFRVVEEDPPFRVLRCLRCSLTFVHPVPEGAVLAGHYDGDYYREWIEHQRKRRVAMWRKRLDKVEKAAHRGRLLDVGCGEGMFLCEAASEGLDDLGDGAFSLCRTSRLVGASAGKSSAVSSTMPLSRENSSTWSPCGTSWSM